MRHFPSHQSSFEKADSSWILESKWNGEKHARASMEATDFEVSLKVVVVGNGSVGKSSMIRR